MNISKSLENSALTLTLEGRLDTTTAPRLEAELRASLQCTRGGAECAVWIGITLQAGCSAGSSPPR